jgi:hypothetical protein
MDDEEGVREIVGALLQHMGHEVELTLLMETKPWMPMSTRGSSNTLLMPSFSI